MRSVLIIVRTEADFERAIPIGIEIKKKFNPVFVFIGDFNPFYSQGISNTFQKNIFEKHNFKIRDFSSFDLISKFLGWLINYRKYNLSYNNFLKFVSFKILQEHIKNRKKKIVVKILKKIKPLYVLTDQSSTEKGYTIEILRQAAISNNIPVYLFTHGAAGGLHAVFSKPKFLEYKNCNVIVCNKNETNNTLKNRIIIGDLSASYNYVHYLNKLNYNLINFLNERKFKIGIMIGGTALHTSTSGWKIKEEIIIDFSENKDVAFVIKAHPRDDNHNLFDMVKKFSNVLVVGNDVDRSRVTKWADIIITNDHCSTVFEPMILGKKVVVIETKKIPKFKNINSPLINSSVNYIKKSSKFKLNSLKNVEKEDKVTNQIAWGDNGPINLVELFVNKHLK